MRTSFFTSLVVVAATGTIFAAASPVPMGRLQTRAIYRPFVASGSGSASSGSSGDVSGGSVINNGGTGGVTNAAGASTCLSCPRFEFRLIALVMI